MAGDWIKIEHVTPDKPEVHAIATELNIDPDAVVGKLVRIWIWADQQTIIGNADSVTESLLDRITMSPGFAKAMKKVGWLTIKNNVATFPNFDRHNGKTAKNRALSSKRVEKFRNAPSVTFSLPEGREEKRREEKREEGGDHPATEIEKNSESKEPSDLVQRWYFFNSGGRPVEAREIAAMFAELRRHGISDAEIAAELENPNRTRGEWPSKFRDRMIAATKNRMSIKSPGESALAQALRAINEREAKNA